MPKGNEPFWLIQNSVKAPKTGEIYLHGPVASAASWFSDTINPKAFKQQLDGLGEVDVINVYINSPGGDVFAGHAIYNMLKRHPADVNCYVDGIAASISSEIAMAGKLFMPGNTMLMIHRASTRVQGNANDMEKMAGDLRKIDDGIIAAYTEKTGQTRDQIIAMFDAGDTWFTAAEAKALGFCDVIMAELQIAASFEDGMFNFAGQSMPVEKMENIAQLIAKLPKTNKVIGLNNTPEGGKDVMDFEALVASLPADHQTLIQNKMVAAMEAVNTDLTTAKAELATAQETLTAVQAELVVAKAGEPVVDEAAMLASLPESFRAKYLADQVKAKASDALVAKLQNEAQDTIYLAKAKMFDRIPVEASAFAKTLRVVAESVPEAFAQIEGVLTAVNAAMGDSDLFKNVGSGSSSTTGVSAIDQLEVKATEIQARDGGTKEQAFAKACKENKDLYTAYSKEERGE